MVYVTVDVNEAIRKEGMRRGFSGRTIQTYQNCVRNFLSKNRKSIDKLSKKDVRLFLEYLSEKGVSGSTINVYHMSIKFLLEEILNKKMKLNIKYNKKPVKLPRVLTKEQISCLFNNINNEKHKLMIKLMYSAGLRVSELVNLKVKELNLSNKQGYVRNGKGGKDRVFIIGDILVEDLRNLMKNKNQDNFLFTTNSGKQYSVRTLQVILKKASKKAKIENWKEIHCHTLRHSFATHLIENGYSVQDVQLLLGHKSPETTMIYLHTAIPRLNIKSPIDSL